MVRRLGDAARRHDRRGRPRRLVARHRRPPERRLPAGAGRLRAHALPALHVGHDGQAQGHHAHHGRLSAGRELHPRDVFDVKPDDVYWCAADIGWVTGHSYIVYGPLANATTSVMYEGAPDTPAWDRWWQIIEEYKVTILYCAPTAIRAFMKQGDGVAREARPVARCACSVRWASRSTPRRGSGTTRNIGGGNTPVVDTWWQTETGHDPDHAAARRHDHQAGLGHVPVPGHRGRRGRRATATSVPLGGGGYLVLKRPWPAMLRGIYGDPERYKPTYWSRFPGMYFAGDGAKRDEEGYFWLLGRVDDVMNVSGHRISTTEVESALVDHPAVAEAAVVGRRGPDHRPGDLRLRDPARLGSEPRDALGERAARARREGDRADRASRSTCCSCRTCPRHGRARSCAACCATSPRAGRWATRRRWPTPAWSTRSARTAGAAEE